MGAERTIQRTKSLKIAVAGVALVGALAAAGAATGVHASLAADSPPASSNQEVGHEGQLNWNAPLAKVEVLKDGKPYSATSATLRWYPLSVTNTVGFWRGTTQTGQSFSLYLAYEPSDKSKIKNTSSIIYATNTGKVDITGLSGTSSMSRDSFMGVATMTSSGGYQVTFNPGPISPLS